MPGDVAYADPELLTGSSSRNGGHLRTKKPDLWLVFFSGRSGAENYPLSGRAFRRWEAGHFLWLVLAESFDYIPSSPMGKNLM